MFRESQLSLLRESVDDLYANYYCEGPKSSGKTITVKKFLDDVSKTPNHTIVYMCSKRAILQDFQRALEKTLGRKLHFRESVFQAIADIPQEHVHFVIDDVPNIMRFKTFNPFIKGIYESCWEVGKKPHVITVGTILYPRFMKFVGDDVESRYHFKPVLFEFYGADEIVAIIKQRLDVIGVPYDESAITFVSAKIKHLIADLRLGFEIVRNACEITQGKEKITEQIILRAWDHTKTEYWKQQLRGMEETLRVLLLCASVAAKKNPLERIVSTQEITNGYRTYCYVWGIEPLYKQRITVALRKLEELGWLTQKEQKSRGRHGLDVEYQYEMTPETVIAALKEMAYRTEELENATESVVPQLQPEIAPPQVALKRKNLYCSQIHKKTRQPTNT